MKKLFIKLLCVIISASFIIGCVGCGRSGGGSTDSNTIRLVLDSKYQSVYDPIIAQFEEQTEYKVDPIYNADPTTKQDTMMGGRDYPDIIRGGDLYIEKYYNVLYDLSYLKNDTEYNFADFYDNTVNCLEKNSKLYMVPAYINTSVLYYNTDLVKGDDVPTEDWTYEDFYAVALKLTKIGAAGATDNIYGCASNSHYWGEWAIHVRQHGGDILGEDGMLALDSDAAKAGIKQFAVKMFGSDANGNLVESSGGSTKYVVKNNRISPTSNDKDYGGFVSGRYAFEYGGHTANIPIYNNTKNLNYDIAYLPKVNDERKGGELAIDAFGIYKNSKSLEAAKAFVEFITGGVGAQMMSDAGFITPRKTIANTLMAVPYEDRQSPKNLEALYGSIEYNSPLPNEAYFVDVMMNSVQPKFSDLAVNKTTIAAMVTDIKEEGDAYIRLKY